MKSLERRVPTTPGDTLRQCLVIGGGGYLGRALAADLHDRGLSVKVFDAQDVHFPGRSISCVRGDVRDPVSVRSAMAGVDTVFHTAAVIDLVNVCGPERRQRSYDINVRGAENVIAGCRAAGVRRLVYTSSSTTVFDGTATDLLTEDHPYPSRHISIYTWTKALAERAVLAANDDDLLTCAIRPSGIYGPGERLHLPRVIDEAVRGRFVALFGDGSALSEWSFVDNVVHAHCLAAQRLRRGSPVCGQAYFINDGRYEDTVEFFRPFLEGIGLRFPFVHLPGRPAVYGARLWEWLHWRLGAPAPMLTEFEVLQMVVRHPCSIERARRELGYAPVVSPEEAVQRCLPYCRQLLHERRAARRSPRRRLAGRRSLAVAAAPGDQAAPAA